MLSLKHQSNERKEIPCPDSTAAAIRRSSLQAEQGSTRIQTFGCRSSQVLKVRRNRYQQRGRCHSATKKILARERNRAGDAYGGVPAEGQFENWPLQSKWLCSWLVRAFYQRHSTPLGSQAFQDALNVLEAKERHDSPEQPVFTRTAELNGAVYLDFRNSVWEVVEITAILCSIPTQSEKLTR